jgi:hypothetical protein
MEIKLQKNYTDNFIQNNKYFNELKLFLLELESDKVYKSGHMDTYVLLLFSVNLNKFRYTDMELKKLLKDSYLLDSDINDFLVNQINFFNELVN